MAVRAKFQCHSELRGSGPSRTYTFGAATSGEDNKSWAKYTPTGSLTMTVDNPAAQTFEPGKYYFLDFTEAT